MEFEINKIIDDIDKYKLTDLNTEIIKNRRNNILTQILDDDKLKHYKKILNDYDTIRLAQTLAHEKVHIYQKIYKDDIQEYLNCHNIYQACNRG